MTDTSQKLREALQAYQDANEMSPYGDYSKIEWESSAGPVNPSWGGGDCKKHGRWYGRCYSCSDEWDNLRKMADRDAYTVRENALNAAKQMARQALALRPEQVPMTCEPGEWNSIQIASWIGSKLMHEPPMFERATVCKFVRSLGRHPTLLKHSPKSHPAPSVPTADHIPDAGKMIETAAPVVERELPPLPSYARWEERIKMLMQQCGHPNSMSIYQAFKQFQNEFEHEMIAYARAAMSAGDAVDAQRYRWLADCNNYEAGLALIIDPKLTEQALGAAIDAAILARGEAEPLTRYRVWPDGAVQEGSESPYAWMSDDFEYVDAVNEEQAALSAAMRKEKP